MINFSFVSGFIAGILFTMIVITAQANNRNNDGDDE